MATADDVIRLPRLRDAIGLVGDESDALLTGLRSSSIELLEKWFRRSIVDRTGWRSEAGQFIDSGGRGVDWIGFNVTDVKASSQIRLEYAPSEAQPGGQGSGSTTLAANDARLHIDQDGVIIYSMDGAAWDTVMRFDYPVPVMVADRGMEASSIPAAWGDAVALMVRAVFDGSAFDDLSSNSALTALTAPWKVHAYMKTIRT